MRIADIDTFRARPPPGGPRPHDGICHTRTRNAAGADARAGYPGPYDHVWPRGWLPGPGLPDQQAAHRPRGRREERHVPRRLNSAGEVNLAAPCPGCSFRAEGHDARWSAGATLELTGFLAFDHWHS